MFVVKKLRKNNIPLLILAGLLPAAYVFYLALKAGPISTTDYWGILIRIYTIDGFSTDPADWLTRQNEHLLFIPYLIFALNIILTNGSNIGLTLLGWLFGLIELILLIGLLPPKLRQSGPVTFGLVCGMAALIFTPSAAHGWIRGFSSVHWVGTNMLAVVAIACLGQYIRRDKLGWLFGSGLLGVMATLTHSTALPLWPALCFGLLLYRRWRAAALYALFTAGIYLAYLAGYHTPADHPVPIYSRLFHLVQYMAVYLGGIFFKEPALAMATGFVGMGLSALGFFLWATSRRLELWPWLLIQLYILGNALISAVGRSGYGIKHAMETRYASLPALFWASLIVGVVFYLTQTKRRKWLLGPTFALLLVLIISMYQLGMDRAQKLLHMVSLQPVAILSIRLDAPDEMAVKAAISPISDQFLAALPMLRANGHVPFHREPELPCPSPGQQIDPARLTVSEKVQGRFDFIDVFAQNKARAVGWAYSPQAKISCVVLLDQENRVQGMALPGVRRSDAAEALKLADPYIGWVGYAPDLQPGEKLTAYARLRDDDRWFALAASRSLQEPGQVDEAIYYDIVFGE